MKIGEYIKAGIGLAIGFTFVASLVKGINVGVDNELKKIQETFGKENLADETEKAE